uniref:Uncharacterized protein n=1 Tax=Nicotiana tabacum TaxID=4097 RepID=A0A1S3XAH2_TOBAC|nr:PREDICTED: uncharacterized protein LOC107762937 [Nicotiana tabacum]
MSNTQSAPLNVDVDSGNHGENHNVVPSNEVPHVYPNGVSAADLIDANSHMAIKVSDRSKRDIDREPRSNRDLYDHTMEIEELGQYHQTEGHRTTGSTRIVDAIRVLNGLNMACETTKEEITLLMNTTGTVQATKFYVIKGDMRYNSLFGRLWIHNMRAVPSTLHQVLKFPIPGGIKTVYEEKSAAKEMFAVDEVVMISTLSTSKNPSSVTKEETK